MKKIENLLRKKVLIFDGACGTELQKRKMPQGVSPELWALKNPGVLSAVHKEYKDSSADVIYTCTFGANRLKLSQFGKYDVRKVNRDLALLARRATGGKALIAGDIGPTGKFLEPFGNLAFEEAVAIFKEQVRGLVDAGVDLFVIETMMDIQEARAALIAVKEITKTFTLVTMTYEKDGRTLNGTCPVTALITLQSLGADAVGCNCSTGPDNMLKLIKLMKPYAKVPLAAKPNAGMPRLVEGKTLFDMKPKEFASLSKKFIGEGVSMVGGCCGTTPLHIRELAKKVRLCRPLLPSCRSLSALSSARGYLLLNRKRPLVVVGECINPTGKKQLRQELQEGKTSFVRKLARIQQDKGAELLDVNAGCSGIDEKSTLRKIVNLLSVVSPLPLVIDSSDIAAVEAALRIYPGRAIINSISAELSRYKKLLPLAAKYGAMFILLPLDKKTIPQTFQKRRLLIRKVLNQAWKLGFSNNDIVIDGMVMAVSSHPKAAKETLKTVAWASTRLSCNTVIGLSNISFGLPNRALLNASYLAMAVSSGLSMVIANPLHTSLPDADLDSGIFLGKGATLAEFIRKFSNSKPLPQLQESSPVRDRIFRAVVEGNKDDILSLIKEALGLKLEASEIINKAMIPAINKVGDLFDRKEYFLPQLISSAETMNLAFSKLKPYLKKPDIDNSKKTVVILATVRGDIHDIGKNIVALMLKNHGFSVIDLGKDVSSKKIIREVKRHKSAVIGLSALMTTTVVNMKDIIDLAKREGIDCRFVIGGAVVTKAYAESLGVCYARDGVEAVRVVKKLSG